MTGSALTRWTLHPAGIGCRVLHSICFKKYLFISLKLGEGSGEGRTQKIRFRGGPADDGKRFEAVDVVSGLLLGEKIVEGEEVWRRGGSKSDRTEGMRIFCLGLFNRQNQTKSVFSRIL